MKKILFGLFLSFAFIISTPVNAATTIGTDINTGGTITGTTATSTNLSGTSFSGFGLSTCNSAGNALTYDGVARFGCNTINSAASSTLLTDTNYFSGLSNTFTNLIATISTTTSATSTAFFSTNLFSTISNAINLIFSTATGTSATTTAFFSTNLFGTITNTANLTSSNATSSTLYTSGQTILGAISGKVGIGTTTPNTQFHVSAGSNATTTVDFGDQYLTSSKSCFNVKNNTGAAISFYFAGISMIIENNRCR